MGNMESVSVWTWNGHWHCDRARATSSKHTISILLRQYTNLIEKSLLSHDVSAFLRLIISVQLHELRSVSRQRFAFDVSVSPFLSRPISCFHISTLVFTRRNPNKKRKKNKPYIFFLFFCRPTNFEFAPFFYSFVYTFPSSFSLASIVSYESFLF